MLADFADQIVHLGRLHEENDGPAEEFQQAIEALHGDANFERFV
jgi:hypothetical protein